MGYPRVRPHVVLAPGKTGALTEHDFVTSFLVACSLHLLPPRALDRALAGGPVRHSDHPRPQSPLERPFFSIELLHESDIEAFSIERPDRVAFANTEFARSPDA